MITGDPLWNSLPAAKIINYPLEKADYKPYAQARLCVSNDDFYIQLLAFEVEPEEKSVVGAAIAPFSEEDGGKRYFWLSTNRGGALVCKFIDEATGNETDISKNVSVRIFTGEDEQGVYWCTNFALPLSLVEKLFGKSYLVPGHRMKGNFYKLCDGKRPHYGSFYPANFTDINPLGSRKSFFPFSFCSHPSCSFPLSPNKSPPSTPPVITNTSSWKTVRQRLQLIMGGQQILISPPNWMVTL